MSSDEDDITIVFNQVPSLPVIPDNTNTSFSSQQFNCPFCPLTTEVVGVLEAHIEIEHLDGKYSSVINTVKIFLKLNISLQFFVF